MNRFIRMSRKSIAGYPVVFLLSLIFPSHNIAQNEIKIDDLLEMSKEKIMNISVVTSSKKEEKLVEAPAAINVITAEEIAFNIISMYSMLR